MESLLRGSFTRKLFILLLASAVTLSVVTNYFNFRTNVTPYDIEKFSSNMKSPWLQYRNEVYRRKTRQKLNSDIAKEFEEEYWPNCTVLNVENENWRRRRNSFSILFNFIRGSRTVSCQEKLITLTTHGEYSYLDNIVPLVERWEGPVSVSIYVPYDDLNPTLHRIAYLRECTSPLMKEWVTFHLFSETRHLRPDPDSIKKLWELWQDIPYKKLCENVPSFNESEPTSRHEHQLSYPVNVGRNVARQGANTTFVLASDIELYPSLDFIPNFFEMLGRESHFFQNRTNPYVFVLPIFEMEPEFDLPDTKDQLLQYLDTNVSVIFHKYVCPQCHTIPKYAEWLEADMYNGLNVFHTAKRRRPFHDWEPIYVSRNNVPLYDERLYWEGLQDKMPQSYQMCLQDYDFMILDNAFLMHKPGIKKKARNYKNPEPPVKKQRKVVQRINRQITRKFGRKKYCLR